MRPSPFPELPAFLFIAQPWADQALCAQVDPERWYPNKGGVSTIAKRVCAACPVQPQCLDWAMVTKQEWGIWGGMSTLERTNLRHARKAAA